MSPARVNIIAEGQTEDTFVRNILQVPLALRGVFVTARLVEFSRSHHVIHRGGLLNYDKAKIDIRNWLAQDPSAYVTTMFDLYALPDNFPGRIAASRNVNPYHKAEALEQALADDIDNRRFIPNIQLHEFEGLLFSDVEAIDDVLKTLQGTSELPKLREIRRAVATPEEINEGLTTAPSKQLRKLYPVYDKNSLGSIISERIGLGSHPPRMSPFRCLVRALGSAWRGRS